MPVDNIQLIIAGIDEEDIEKVAVAPLVATGLNAVRTVVPKLTQFASKFNTVGKGAGVKSAANTVKRKGVVGKMHGHQMDLLKQMTTTPLGVGLTTASVASMGPGQVARSMFPVVDSTLTAASNVGKDLKMLNRVELPSNTFNKGYKHADDTSNAIEKAAVEFNPAANTSNMETKDIINTVGASLAGGGLGYLGAKKGLNYIDNLSLTTDLSGGVQKAVRGVGRGTAKTLSRSRGGTGVLANVLARSGQFAETLGGGGPRPIRTDFSTLSGKPTALSNIKTLGKFVGILAGAALAEEYFANWARNKVDESIVDYKVNRLNSKVACEQPGEEKFAAVPTTRSVQRINVKGPQQVKNKDFKRLIHDRGIRPLMTTSAFIFTLGGLSHLAGRNLAGGMERVERDQYRPANRVIIDISDRESLDKYYKSRPDLKVSSYDGILDIIEKTADTGGDVAEINALNDSTKPKASNATQKSKIHSRPSTKATVKVLRRNPALLAALVAKGSDIPATAVKGNFPPKPTKLELAKRKVDSGAEKVPGLKQLSEFFKRKDTYKYTGETGLGHMVLEEAPFKAFESFAYVTPVVAAAAVLGKNPRRGFAPIQTDPNTPYVPEGMTRVIIQESGYRDSRGDKVYEKPVDYTKYASEEVTEDTKSELDKIQELIAAVSLDENARREARALQFINKRDGIVGGVKKKERIEL